MTSKRGSTMASSDDDIQAAWWKCCDFICSAADTILFLGILAISFFCLCSLGTLIMMVVE